MIARRGIAFVAAAVMAALPAGAIAQTIDISGFLSLEMAWHHNAGGETRVWWEVNRLRLDFNSQLNNHVSVLAEFAPVPEEITHQIDELHLSDGRDLPIQDSATGIEEPQENIPFERIEVRWQDIAGPGLNLSFGQLRNPFGHWEDFSVHRNVTLTKNNSLVLGIAMRNLDLGIQADGDVGEWMDYRLAIRKGNSVSTVNLGRDDNNSRYDAVGRLGCHRGTWGIGINGYSVDSRFDKFALGADWQASIAKLSLMGEVVLEKNTPARLRSLAGYAQANYSLAQVLAGLRCYLLGDYWRLEADSKLEREALNLATGIKYKILAQGLTLGLEWGRTYISAAPDPWHLTAQMALGF